MNILYLTDNAGRASTTVPTRGWFESLLPRGLRPVLVSPITGEFSEWAAEQQIPFYQLNLPFPNKTRPWSFGRSLWALQRIVRQHNIQLIHCNEQQVHPIGSYLARICNVPTVVSVHFTMNRGFCEWAFGGWKQPQRVFFISPGNLEECRPGIEGVVDSSRWRMLPNGLDLQHYRSDPVRRAQFRQEHNLGDGPVIGVGCAIRERKQLEHMLEASTHLPPNVRVVIAGGPVPDEKEYAESFIAPSKAKYGDRLVFVGYLTELRGLYNALDLFVNTSREEACSISVLESMACGCPVIGYPSKSVDGQILPGGGEIVEQDNIGELASALNRWLGDSQQLALGKSGARRRVEEGFDIRKLSEQLWHEYQEIVDGQSSSATRKSRELCSAV